MLRFAAWGIQWTVALVIFLVVMVASAYYVYTVTLEAGEPVQVPSIVNLPLEEALIRLAEQGLETGRQEPVPHDTLPKSHIVSQRPAPGRVVRTGRKVYMTISMGKDYHTAIDLTSRYLDNAKAELEASPFRLGNVARVPDSKPRNMVLAQDPPPGHEIGDGESIHVLVSDGDGRYQDYMPDLMGKPISEIEGIMAPYKVNLVPVEVDYPGAREDIVLNQDPQPDSLIFEGQTVTYEVMASAPPPAPAEIHDATIRHEMNYDWYNRDVRLELVDGQGSRKVLVSLPAATDDESQRTRVRGSTIKYPFQYTGTCVIDVFVDDVVVASYSVENGEAPVRTTPSR